MDLEKTIIQQNKLIDMYEQLLKIERGETKKYKDAYEALLKMTKEMSAEMKKYLAK